MHRQIEQDLCMEREGRKRDCVNEKARGSMDDYLLLVGLKKVP